jgi:hypothetical protein
MATKIYQGMDVPFYAVDVRDCVIMCDLMNQLVDCINADNACQKIQQLPKETLNDYISPWANVYIDQNKAEDIYRVLTSLGFVSTKDIIPFDLINIEAHRK